MNAWQDPCGPRDPCGSIPPSLLILEPTCPCLWAHVLRPHPANACCLGSPCTDPFHSSTASVWLHPSVLVRPALQPHLADRECEGRAHFDVPSCKNFCFGPSVVQCPKIFTSCILLSLTVLFCFVFSQNKTIISVTIPWSELVERDFQIYIKTQHWWLCWIKMLNKVEMSQIFLDYFLLIYFLSILGIHMKFLINVYSCTLIVWMWKLF